MPTIAKELKRTSDKFIQETIGHDEYNTLIAQAAGNTLINGMHEINRYPVIIIHGLDGATTFSWTNKISSLTTTFNGKMTARRYTKNTPDGLLEISGSYNPETGERHGKFMRKVIRPASYKGDIHDDKTPNEREEEIYQNGVRTATDYTTLRTLRTFYILAKDALVHGPKKAWHIHRGSTPKFKKDTSYTRADA